MSKDFSNNQPIHPPNKKRFLLYCNRITLPQHKPHSIVHHHLPVCLLTAPQPHQALSGSRFMYEEATIKTMEAVARHQPNRGPPLSYLPNLPTSRTYYNIKHIHTHCVGERSFKLIVSVCRNYPKITSFRHVCFVVFKGDSN